MLPSSTGVNASNGIVREAQAALTPLYVKTIV